MRWLGRPTEISSHTEPIAWLDPRQETMTLLVHRKANRQYEAIPDDEVWQFTDSKEKIYVAFPMENSYPTLRLSGSAC